MAANLQKHGHSLAVINRARAKAEPLLGPCEHFLIPRQKLPIKWISYLRCWKDLVAPNSYPKLVEDRSAHARLRLPETIALLQGAGSFRRILVSAFSRPTLC
jgi:hypothetical protein